MLPYFFVDIGMSIDTCTSYFSTTLVGIFCLMYRYNSLYMLLNL